MTVAKDNLKTKLNEEKALEKENTNIEEKSTTKNEKEKTNA